MDKKVNVISGLIDPSCLKVSSSTSHPSSDRALCESVEPEISVEVGASALSVVSEKAKIYTLDDAQRLDPLTFPDQPNQGSHARPCTIPNARHLIASYGITVRYNVIKKKLQIFLPGHAGTSDNADNTAMTQIISLATLNGISNGQVPSFVDTLGDKNPYNPVDEWIGSKSWDKKDRLADVCGTLTVRADFPERLKNVLVCKWLLSATAAALMPSGFKGRGVLTFQGPQGIGKTSWLTSLVTNPTLREMVVKVDHHLDPSNKDSILGAVTHWLVEIGELDSSFKKDVSRLKGVLTSDSDKVRRPYARTESEYPRRTVFFATVNENNFLVDSTGNSRWWTIPLVAINYQHSIDMQQVFAQLAEQFRNGQKWWLTAEEERLLEQHNSQHRSVSVIREQLVGIIDLAIIDRQAIPALTSTDVLNKLGVERPTNTQCKECTSILRELLGESTRVQGNNKWRVPFKRSSAQIHTKVPACDEDGY